MLDQLEYAVFLFLCIVEYSIIAVIILAWMPYLGRIRDLLLYFLDPLYSFIRYLLKHSTYRTSPFDMTPLIALLIITFLKLIFSNG